MTEYKIDPLDVSFEPLAGSTFINLLRLLIQNKLRVNIIGIPRIIYSIILSLILSPFNFYEGITCSKKIKNTCIDKPPIFIIGHWRSGTTYLHNILTQNPDFGFPSTFQTITPGLFLKFEKQIKPIVASSLPPTRPQDNIVLGVDLPQEEEYGIGNISPYSFYHGWCFPKNRDFYYDFVHFDKVSKNRINEWKKIYLYYLKKVTLYNQGKQLVLKNPSNTSRVKLLLELFPDAKFIHIYRNPYFVFLSMKRNIKKEMTLYCVQTPADQENFEIAMIKMYNRMYEKYFDEKKLIPEGNLVEVRYEDLKEKPYEVIKKIYHDLSLNDFEKNQYKINSYIKTQFKVNTHKYNLDEKQKNKIYKYFKKTIELWQYKN